MSNNRSSGWAINKTKPDLPTNFPFPPELPLATWHTHPTTWHTHLPGLLAPLSDRQAPSVLIGVWHLCDMHIQTSISQELGWTPGPQCERSSLYHALWRHLQSIIIMWHRDFVPYDTSTLWPQAYLIYWFVCLFVDYLVVWLFICLVVSCIFALVVFIQIARGYVCTLHMLLLFSSFNEPPSISRFLPLFHCFSTSTLHFIGFSTFLSFPFHIS